MTTPLVRLSHNEMIHSEFRVSLKIVFRVSKTKWKNKEEKKTCK